MGQSRNSAIVFFVGGGPDEGQILAGARISHRIDTGDVNINIPWNGRSRHFMAEMPVEINQMVRDDGVLEDPAGVRICRAVETKRCRPLRKAALYGLPF